MCLVRHMRGTASELGLKVTKSPRVFSVISVSCLHLIVRYFPFLSLFDEARHERDLRSHG